MNKKQKQKTLWSPPENIRADRQTFAATWQDTNSLQAPGAVTELGLHPTAGDGALSAMHEVLGSVPRMA